jgi:hypothetical protein
VADPDGYRGIMLSDFLPLDACNIIDGCDCPADNGVSITWGCDK